MTFCGWEIFFVEGFKYWMWSVRATVHSMQHPTKMRAHQKMELLATTKTLLSRDFLMKYWYDRIFDIYLQIFGG